jgi:predicted transcriptional regulator
MYSERSREEREVAGMPGGRLTAEDRQRVAAGLAQGLDYAEIARQLGRPTSTVSREVARNGGPGGYRADHAHEATGRRARRARSTPYSELPSPAEAGGRDPELVQGFLREFVTLMVQTGLPRMAARVFACLVTTDSGSLTAAELVQRLRVSPASVSKAVAYLEGLEMVRRERDQRRERYIVDDDLWLRTWRRDAERHAKWADTTRRGVGIFGGATSVGARLDTMSRFFTELAGEMAGGPISGPAVDDVLTIIAALVFTGVPTSVDQLAAALDWQLDRVRGALDDALRYPAITDPVALQRTGSTSYSLTAHGDRLSAAQRRSLLSS